MPHQRQVRTRLIGFRVTPSEHDLIYRAAVADERTLTGLLRKVLAESVAGFKTTALSPTDTRERNQ